MARPTVISDTDLLNVAREVFLEKGLSATTAEIAERAGVSQGSIFKRYKTKNALFQAAMDMGGDLASLIPIDFDACVGQANIQETLIKACEFLATKFLKVVPTMMMAWSNRQDEPGKVDENPANRLCEEGPKRGVRSIEIISSYLRAEAKLGRVKSAQFEVLAESLIGACWYYAFLKTTIGETHTPAMSPRQYAEQTVNNLWMGLSPEA